MALTGPNTTRLATWLYGPSQGKFRAESRREEHDRLRTWRAIWSTTCEGVGLAVEVAVPAGRTAVVPPLLGVVDRPGRPLVLVVDMLRGQVAEDYTAVAPRLAVALDAAMVAVVTRGGRTLGLELHDTDPVTEPYRATLPVLRTCQEPVILGRAEDGTVLGHSFAEPAHLAGQGQSGSGKSRLSYGLISQLIDAEDLVVAGSDITGLLLGPPFDGTRHRPWQAAGTSDLPGHADLLDALVAEMDRRLASMPRGVDSLVPTPATPLVLVVMEEFPGLLRAAGTCPKPARGERSVLDRIKSANLRLLSEGRKAAFRVLTLAQRAEADTMGGGYAREQYALTISFRVPADSLVMLHGDDARDLGARHRTADPGIAVVSAPGRPLVRMRAPHVGDYAEYCTRISGARGGGLDV